MPPTKLSTFRSQYPQYNDMSDYKLAQALHAKFYPDLDFAKFGEDVGLQAAPSPPVQQEPFYPSETERFLAPPSRESMGLPPVEIPDSAKFKRAQERFEVPSLNEIAYEGTDTGDRLKAEREKKRQQTVVKDYVKFKEAQGKLGDVSGATETSYTQLTGEKIDKKTGKTVPLTQLERKGRALKGAGTQVAEMAVGGAATIAGGWDIMTASLAADAERAGYPRRTSKASVLLDQYRQDLKNWQLNNPQHFARKSVDSAADYIKDPWLAVDDALASSGYMAAIGATSAINPALGVATAMELGMGEVYGVARDAGADPLQASMYAMIGGPIYGGIEMIGWGQIARFGKMPLNTMKTKAYQSMTRKVLQKTAEKGKQLLKDEVFLALTEGLEEGLQGVIEQGVLTLVSGKKIKVSDFLNKFGKDFVQGGIVAGVMGNTGMAVRYLARGKAAQTKAEQDKLGSDIRATNDLIANGVSAEEAESFVFDREQAAPGITTTPSGPVVSPADIAPGPDVATTPSGPEVTIPAPQATTEPAQPAAPKPSPAAEPSGEFVFVRKPTKAELVGGTVRRRGFNNIPDKAGYEKVYKPYGLSGEKKDAGYYYQKLPTAKPTAPVTPTAQAPEPTPTTEPKQRARALRPIEGTGEKAISGLAADIEAIAVEKKLAAGLEGVELPEFERIKLKEQAERVLNVLAKNPEKAQRIAKGLEHPVRGTTPEAFFIAVRNQAIRNGDSGMLRDLATSRIPKEVSTIAQRLGSLRGQDESGADPVAAMVGIAKAREEAVARRKPKGGLAKAQKEFVSSARKAVDTAVRTNLSKASVWAKFIKSIEC